VLDHFACEDEVEAGIVKRKGRFRIPDTALESLLLGLGAASELNSRPAIRSLPHHCRGKTHEEAVATATSSSRCGATSNDLEATWNSIVVLRGFETTSPVVPGHSLYEISLGT